MGRYAIASAKNHNLVWTGTNMNFEHMPSNAKSIMAHDYKAATSHIIEWARTYMGGWFRYMNPKDLTLWWGYNGKVILLDTITGETILTNKEITNVVWLWWTASTHFEYQSSKTSDIISAYITDTRLDTVLELVPNEDEIEISNFGLDQDSNSRVIYNADTVLVLTNCEATVTQLKLAYSNSSTYKINGESDAWE